MTPEMRHAVEVALEAFRRVMAHDREPYPTAYLVPDAPGKTVDVFICDNNFMETWQSKNKLGALLLTRLFKRGGTLAMVSDGWAGKLPEGKTRRDMPNSLAEWPEEFRHEVLMCYVNQVGERGHMVQQWYDRNPDGSPSWGEVEWDLKGVHGRWCFDLTHGNLERAITDAIMRTREGTSGIQ